MGAVLQSDGPSTRIAGGGRISIFQERGLKFYITIITFIHKLSHIELFIWHKLIVYIYKYMDTYFFHNFLYNIIGFLLLVSAAHRWPGQFCDGQSERLRLACLPQRPLRPVEDGRETRITYRVCGPSWTSV